MTERTMDEYAAAARDILDNLLRLGEFSVSGIEQGEDQGQIEFRVASEDNGRLIGRTSQTLDAIQFLLNRIMSRKFDDAPYCVVDVADYRARRREKLVGDALAAAEEVLATGRPWRMPMLNSMDRRVIHRALAEVEGIETHSEDPDYTGRKRVVITLADGVSPRGRAEEVAPGADDVDYPPEEEDGGLDDLAAEDGALPPPEGSGEADVPPEG
ncbi:MAG: KH domain-containing protein [Kiritimatiellae bacterium]|nr:KH domain-containing protein [Kiritimatiellia bacterium]